MNFAALKIPPFIRKPKGQPAPDRVEPVDIVLSGEDKDVFVKKFIHGNAHIGADELRRIHAAEKLIGNGTPPVGLAEPKFIGAMFGRYWYTA